MPRKDRGGWMDLAIKAGAKQAEPTVFQTLQEIRKEIGGMKQVHREFECNGANNGKGCYETWCDFETCIAKDAMCCKGHNEAIDKVLALIDTKLNEGDVASQANR